MRKLAETISSIARGLRAVLGVPDYSRYAEHMREAHPSSRVMTRDEFYRERFEARYSKPGAKCC